MVLLNEQMLDQKEMDTILEWLNERDDERNSDKCPICGSDDLLIQGRCTTCVNCGWSQCSL